MQKKRYVLENIKGNVRDVGAGKQPPETIYQSVNFVLDKELGSMKSRNGYSAGITPPSDLTTLDFHLTKPVTSPISEDTHLYFYTDAGTNKKIAIQPFRHTSSAIATTASLGATGFVDVNESVTIVPAIGKGTVNPSPTNTIVIATANSVYGLSTTNSYYKNWRLLVDNSNTGLTTEMLVKEYSYSADTATFTVDTVREPDGNSNIDPTQWTIFQLTRYFHYDSNIGGTQPIQFTPTYIDPDSYSTDIAVRWSGGLGSTVGYKNCKWNYLNKWFFKYDGTYRYNFIGSYAEQAECLAPSTGILKSLTSTNLSAIALLASKNSTFDTNTLTDWSAVGNHYINGAQSSIYPSAIIVGQDEDAPLGQQDLYGTGIVLSATGAGDSTSYYITTSGTYTTTASTYTFKLNYSAEQGGNILNWSLGTVTGTIALPAGNSFAQQLEYDFTAANAAGQALKLWFSGSTTCNVNIFEINIILKASNRKTLPTAKTARVYASFIYDGFQESEYTYLGGAYINNALMYFVAVFNIGLGNLNKNITGIRLYLSMDSGDTTTNSNTTTYSPKYLVKEILIADDTTNAWTLNTATGKFELTVNIDGDLWAKKGLTWEQKTKRVASASTTCSYSIANTITGRTFLAQYYDYAEGKQYTNALRYAGFNSDGVMCPDIFPNIPDFFITYINSGAGNDIKSITEFNRTAIIHKEASMLTLTTADEQPLWQLRVIDNSTGCLNKWIPEILEDSLIWADVNDVYAWSGGSVRSLTEKIWRQVWQTYSGGTASNYKTWINFKDKTFNISIFSTSYFKIKLNGEFTLHSATNNIQSQVTTKNGSIYFATSSGASYLFDSTLTDAGTPFGCSFDTGEIAPEPFRMINIEKWYIHNTITGTLTGDLIVTVSVDGTTVQTYTITAPSTVNPYLEVPVPSGVKGHRFRIKFNNARGFKTDGAISIHRVGIDYRSDETYGDVSYKT